MTRISSLLVASTLAILPLSAFAQQTAAPAKTAEPTVTTTTAPVAGKTAVATPAKPEVKTKAADSKTDMHGMNTDTTHHTKVVPPAKS